MIGYSLPNLFPSCIQVQRVLVPARFATVVGVQIHLPTQPAEKTLKSCFHPQNSSHQIGTYSLCHFLQDLNGTGLYCSCRTTWRPSIPSWKKDSISEISTILVCSSTFTMYPVTCRENYDDKKMLHNPQR